MKRLILLRHAEADRNDRSVNDEDRPLAEGGHNSAPLVGRHLQDEGVQPDLVLCSTALRARATLDHLTPALDGAPVIYDRRLYTFNGGHLIERLRELLPGVGTVMVVGHNPALQEAALALADTRSGAEPPQLQALREAFPPAGLAVLACMIDDWDELDRGTCTLCAFKRPQDIGG